MFLQGFWKLVVCDESNRGKKSNKKLDQKDKHFLSNLTFKVHDQERCSNIRRCINSKFYEKNIDPKLYVKFNESQILKPKDDLMFDLKESNESILDKFIKKKDDYHKKYVIENYILNENYDDCYNVIIFRQSSGHIPGINEDNPELSLSLINKVLNLVNIQKPQKNVTYNSMKINLCNYKRHLYLNPNYNIHMQKFRDILLYKYKQDENGNCEDIKNKENYHYYLNEKNFKYLDSVDINQFELKLRKTCSGIEILNDKVYMSVYFRLKTKKNKNGIEFEKLRQVVAKIYTQKKIYISGSNDILFNYRIYTELSFMLYYFSKYTIKESRLQKNTKSLKNSFKK